MCTFFFVMHPNQLKPSVFGPVESMRGALWSVFDGDEFHHVDKVCYLTFLSFLSNPGVLGSDLCVPMSVSE